MAWYPGAKLSANIYSTQWMPYRNGQQGMGSGLQPINVKLYISLHPDTKSRDPPQSGSVTHSCQLRNQQNSLGCGGIRTSPSKITSVQGCTKDSVQGGSQSHPSGCTLEVGRGQRHPADAVPNHCSFQARLWMYCVWHSIQYQFTTTWQHPQRWHPGHFAPAQSPVCTRRPRKLLWRNVGWSCPWINIWKLVPALTTQHIMHYMNLTQPQEICIFLGQMEKVEWPDPRQNPWVSK